MKLKTESLFYKNILRTKPFELEKGKLTIVLGQNGAGKSTFLRALCGLNPTLLSKVYLNGKTLSSYSEAERACQIAWLPAHFEQAFPYTLRELCLIGRYPWNKGVFTERDFSHVSSTLKMLELESMEKRLLHELSSGERKLAELARLLSGEQQILLLDEPTAHLDFKNSHKVFSKLKELTRKKGKNILLTSHNIELSQKFADQILFFHSGRILGNTSPCAKTFPLLFEKSFGLLPLKASPLATQL